MAKIKVLHDLKGETLTIYFGDPSVEQVCTEVGDGVILIKNESNEIIGFEKLYFKPNQLGELILEGQVLDVD